MDVPSHLNIFRFSVNAQDEGFITTHLSDGVDGDFKTPELGLEKIYVGTHVTAGKWDAGRLWTSKESFRWYIHWDRRGYVFDGLVRGKIDLLVARENTSCKCYGVRQNNTRPDIPLPELRNVKVRKSGVSRGITWVLATQYDEGYPRAFFQSSLNERVYGAEGRHKMYKLQNEARYDLRIRYRGQLEMGILPSEVIDPAGNLLSVHDRDLLIRDRQVDQQYAVGRRRGNSPTGAKFDGEYTCLHNLSGRLILADRKGGLTPVRLKISGSCGHEHCIEGNAIKYGCPKDTFVVIPAPHYEGIPLRNIPPSHWQNMYHECVTAAKQLPGTFGVANTTKLNGDTFRPETLFGQAVSLMVSRLGISSVAVAQMDASTEVFESALNGDIESQHLVKVSLNQITGRVIRANSVNTALRDVQNFVSIFPELKLTFSWFCANYQHGVDVLRMLLDLFAASVRNEEDTSEKIASVDDPEFLVSHDMRLIISGFRHNVWVKESGLHIMCQAAARSLVLTKTNSGVADALGSTDLADFVKTLSELSNDKIHEYVLLSGVTPVNLPYGGYVGVHVPCRVETLGTFKTAFRGDRRPEVNPSELLAARIERLRCFR